MSREIDEFLRTYTRALEESTAAIFAGAGLSKPAGYVNWKELLKEIASEIQLDIDKETDLIEVAQYHVNESGGNRGKINQILIDEFTKDTDITENHKILARLPIKTYWTTNYDKLIEDSLKATHKRCDTKITQENLAITLPNCDATVYKMHGDISLPSEAVLTKDDYESYNSKRKLFTTSLRGDLITKTFLFIGFSFDDPNLEYILSRIRILLGTNQRPHYCFMRKVQRGKEYKTEEDFLYAEIKQELKIKDLKRFNIKVLLVDQHSEITEVLTALENRTKRKNVFISGSASNYGDWGEDRSFKFASLLSKEVIKSNNNIVTGFGLGIGSCVISGALEEIYKTNNKRVEERLISRPFPQQTVGKKIEELWTLHRNNIIENVGISIFIFGNKFKGETLVEADGMLEEFEISIRNGSIPIPIGVTGFTAKTLWDRVMSDFESYVPYPELEKYYKVLGINTLKDDEIIEKIVCIINELKRKTV
ncbi:SIR2 family protein [Lysinibacillus sp. FSL W8-0953]|uniref:SIR2 family protein n=1 Tax=Lysinibacillus sp. FSL W8-0953 TaxID=2954640 RepID=UPI0030FA6990